MGNRIVVTSHGRPVATITKSKPLLKSLSSLERKRRRLAAEGKLILGNGNPIPDFTPPPGVTGLAAQVLADRR
jgi:antitoxin (DNA-binding transcriptional repressor) of toxin-antitoxin stability system